MKTRPLIIMCSLLLAGCAGEVAEEITYREVALNPPTLELHDPRPITRIAPPEYIVMNAETSAAYFTANPGASLYAITVEDYERLSVRNAEQRRYQADLQAQIDSYKYYYANEISDWADQINSGEYFTPCITGDDAEVCE